MPTIKLSNLIVKAYIKGDRRKISFHLNSHLLIPTSRYFDSIELRNLSGKFVLTTGEQISFAKASWTCSETDYDYSFNDRTKVIEIHLSKVVPFVSLKSSVIEIELLCAFTPKAPLTNSSVKIKASGLLRKMYDERRF